MGLHLNRLDEPIFVATLLFRMRKLGDYEKFYAACLLSTFIFDVTEGQVPI